MGWAHRWRPPGGEGYGGEAKGARTTTMKPPFDAANQPPSEHKAIGHMEAKEYREALRAKLAAKIEVYERATEPEQPIMAQLKAMEMMENRVFGQAKQVIETQEDTRTDDEIRAEIAKRQRELGV